MRFHIKVRAFNVGRRGMVASPFQKKKWPRLWGGGEHRLALITALFGLVAFAHSSPAAGAEEITGTWLTDDGEGAIEIRPCGEQRRGRIAWMKDPLGKDGKPPVDEHNPDPNLRSRRICGLQIIYGLKPQSDGTWGDGRVYNPENGKTYSMEIRRQTADLLKVTGYLGFSLLGQTMEWRRAPKALPGCSTEGKR
jgi:uncharacterized protein (DUF2147 family)